METPLLLFVTTKNGQHICQCTGARVYYYRDMQISASVSET
jgi:hypothetical protein